MMNDERIAAIRAMTDEIKALRMADHCEVATAELATFDDPLLPKLDELIAEQKRTNELLEALLKQVTDPTHPILVEVAN